MTVWGESYYREEGSPGTGFFHFPRPQDDVWPYLLGYIILGKCQNLGQIAEDH